MTTADAADTVVIRQERTFGVFAILLLIGPLGLLFLLSAPLVLIEGSGFNGGLVIMSLLGLLMTAVAVNLVRQAATRAVRARIDRTGVAFEKIRDPRFRTWDWTEIAAVGIRTVTVRGTTVRDLRFELYRSARVDELRSTLRRRDIWGNSRDTQLGYQTNIRFSVGVRPRRGDVIVRLGELAPARLTTSGY